MSDDASTSKSGKTWRIAVIILLAALSIAGWCRLRVDSSLEPLLPEKSEARQTVTFLANSSFASKIVLWFRLRGDAPVTDLFSAADDAEKHLDPELIKRVIHPPQMADAMDQVMGLLDHAGELTDEKDLNDVKAATSPAALSKRMRESYLQLLRPEGSFMQAILRKDPLGTSTQILNRLNTLSKGMGFRVELKDGRLMHADGRQLLMVLETSSSATNLVNSQKLVAELNQIAAAAPPTVEIIPIGAQIHTTENQRLMQSDTRLCGIINGIVFLLLFLLVSRDWRVASIFLLPIISIAMTIGLCALVYPKLSLMVVGVSLTMAGSAVDYGIFVYTAVSTTQNRKAELRRILVPLLISHLTTVGVFLGFLFSAIPAYRQIGWLTSLSLVLSLLASLFLLPKLIRPGGKILLLNTGMPLQKWGQLMVPAAAIGVVLLIVALGFAAKTNFNSDITKLDGVSPIVRQHDDEFQKTWGRSDAELGMVVATGKTREQADQTSDKIYQHIAAKFAPGDYVSLSSFWPSAGTRQANQARWNQFWSEARIANLRRDLATAGEPYGFAADAFDPFFQTLTQPPPNDQTRKIVSAIEDQFVARAGDDYQILNYFPDTEANVKMARDLLRDQPDVMVVSRRALGDAFAESAVSETRLLISISTAFIVIFLMALTRSPLKSFLIMLPALVGLISMLAMLAALHQSMNMVTVVAAIAVLALASDYGVFAVYAWDNREPLLGQGMASIHLCALTTVMGTTAMIFARHPALYLVGVSLTSGLLGGYITGLFVIPALCHLRDQFTLKTPVPE